MRQRAADQPGRHGVLAMMWAWLRMFGAFDLLLSIFLMLEGEVFGSKILCGIGFICVLTSLWLLRKIRSAEEES
jgi:hypothetical protein